MDEAAGDGDGNGACELAGDGSAAIVLLPPPFELPPPPHAASTVVIIASEMSPSVRTGNDAA